MPPKIYNILNNSLIYRLSQLIFAPGANIFLGKKLNYLFKNYHPLILDIGCGPKLQNPNCQNGYIVGLDINFNYLKSYATYQTESKFKVYSVQGSADNLPFKNNNFSQSRTVGLLHHLPDSAAEKTIKELLRVTKDQGEIIIVDNVWPRNIAIRPLAWLTRKLDRGEHIRSEKQLLEMINKLYPFPFTHERFTYTLTGLEILIIRLVKC